ncbi:SAV_2336 family protein [Micromonospora zamorensis]|uniref:SAV_2336 N-terminal domain-related protein n=1 Tax=Micromonospora zamorensis TaxID=709883 RepID=UPI00386993F6|nr:SAV_2336 family protein [Micromonospora zamorensis]
MIDRLARVLAGAFPDCDAQQLVETVLLAARWAEAGSDSADLLTPRNEDRATLDNAPVKQTAESTDTAPTSADLTLPAEEMDSLGGGGVRVTEVGLRLPATASPTPATATALSLFRRVHQPGPPAVDVDATVEATADARRLVVVTRPSRERGLDAAIVVDRTPVALAWAQVIDELERILRRTGAFRSVTRWTLDHTARPALGEPLVRDSAGVVHQADQLVDPAGRRLVLVLSDGTGDAWRRSGTWHVLRRWAWAMPTTLVHLLPPSYWGWTAIGQPSGVVRSLRPAEPNPTLEFRSAWWSDEDVPSRGVPIPVIDLEPDSIVRWARAIVSGSAWTEAVWARPPGPAADLASGAALSPEDRVSTFETRASASAQRLAHILAGAPLLSLPLIQVLHKHLVPEPSTSQVAELMVSGLLERLPEKTGERGPLLRFLPGVGDLLYRGTTISQEWDLYELLTAYLEKKAGSGDLVRALVADPDGAGVVASDLVPFAAMGRGMALRLGLNLGTLPPAAPPLADLPLINNARRYLLLCAPDQYHDETIVGNPTGEVATLNRLFESMGYATIPVPQGTASRRAILEAVRRFYRDPDRRPDDLVVLYLSSHGAVVNGEFRLLAADTQIGNVVDTGIAMPDLARMMFEGPTVCRNLVIIDSSYAGAAVSELTSAALEASVSWFSVVASTSAAGHAIAHNFYLAMASTIMDWLAEPVGRSSLTLDWLVHGINARMQRSGRQRAQSGTFAITDSATSAYFTRHHPLPVQSEYLQIVRQIAPEQLMDRESELAELVAFCTAPDSGPSYLLLSAPPWAGKSALLASFVLDPPSGVRVVPFFVTTRYAGQSDRTAFLDVTIEQLAELLNEPLPGSLIGATREAHWRQLLTRAAVSCRRAGQRLVLIIDGLDEDLGISAEADSFSIAGLLPVRPPAGMRVIAAARPSPPLPSDVPIDHPLRGADVRHLTPSSHATMVWAAAARELHRVFDSDSAALDVIGLIVAAGGGLSGPDIGELTGLQSREIENNLAVNGRLLSTRRGQLRPDTVMYLISHEELQNRAAELLGPRLLEYRTRLEAWVAKYRLRNWPADTPEYLLTGYFRLLASTGSVSQMLELVLDLHRQARLKALTGNDDALLAQIVILMDTPGDLLHRERLVDLLAVIEQRNFGVPDALPVAWAALGEMARAKQLARTIENPNERVRVLAELAHANTVREQRLRQHQVAVEKGDNSAAQFGESGGAQPDLIVIESSIRSYRWLAEANPDVYLPDLAASLSDFAGRLSEVGRREEALVSLEEVVMMRRRLAEANPSVYLPDLAASLDSLGTIFANLGRQVEALNLAAEAAKIRARMATSSPQDRSSRLQVQIPDLRAGDEHPVPGRTQSGIVDMQSLVTEVQASTSGLERIAREASVDDLVALVGFLHDDVSWRLVANVCALRPFDEVVNVGLALADADAIAQGSWLLGASSEFSKNWTELARRLKQLRAEGRDQLWELWVEALRRCTNIKPLAAALNDAGALAESRRILS